jgi:hypothetical protein
MDITGAKLLGDGKSILVEVRELGPAMQLWLRYNLKSAAGKPLRGDVYHTIHRLGAAVE